jgi:hypothetical protein
MKILNGVMYALIGLLILSAACSQQPTEIDGLKLGPNKIISINEIRQSRMEYNGEAYSLTVPAWAFYGQAPEEQYSRSATWVMVGPGKQAKWLRGANDERNCPKPEPCPKMEPCLEHKQQVSADCEHMATVLKLCEATKEAYSATLQVIFQTRDLDTFSCIHGC